MGIIGWTFFWVGITFTAYIGIAIWSRVSDTAVRGLPVSRTYVLDAARADARAAC